MRASHTPPCSNSRRAHDIYLLPYSFPDAHVRILHDFPRKEPFLALALLGRYSGSAAVERQRRVFASSADDGVWLRGTRDEPGVDEPVGDASIAHDTQLGQSRQKRQSLTKQLVSHAEVEGNVQ